MTIAHIFAGAQIPRLSFDERPYAYFARQHFADGTTTPVAFSRETKTVQWEIYALGTVTGAYIKNDLLFLHTPNADWKVGEIHDSLVKDGTLTSDEFVQKINALYR